MRTAYFDCFSGVSGDMIAGAFLDAGAPEAELRAALARVPLTNYQIETRRETRGAFVGTRFIVHTAPEHHHRRLRDIIHILEHSSMPDRVFHKASQVFTTIARAEARAHGISEDEVHFHEVGAVDTIIDIVAGCYCFELLNIEHAAASAVELGGGMVACAHGNIPVPAPGTIGSLLGARVRIGGLAGERTTPTGAAILATFVSSYGEPVEMIPKAVGHGAGSRDTKDVANLLRIIIGETELRGDEIVVLESNLDDASGETVGFVLERAMAAGALDAFVAPVTMKKGRPGFVVTVLSPLELRLELENLLFRETQTLGVRRHTAQRSKLRREVRTFTTMAGDARAKLRWLPDGEIEVSAEFEDAKKIANDKNIPLAKAVEMIEQSAAAAIHKESQTPAKPPEHKHSHGHDHSHSHEHPHSHEHKHSHDHPHQH
ncbi:MAG: nickel pincer cofactor biosynthesis protein LarC [Planctomycetota bacterium]